MSKYRFDYLKEKANWTDELKYVHRSRLLFGWITGMIIGFIAGIKL